MEWLYEGVKDVAFRCGNMEHGVERFAKTHKGYNFWFNESMTWPCRQTAACMMFTLFSCFAPGRCSKACLLFAHINSSPDPTQSRGCAESARCSGTSRQLERTSWTPNFGCTLHISDTVKISLTGLGLPTLCHRLMPKVVCSVVVVLSWSQRDGCRYTRARRV